MYEEQRLATEKGKKREEKERLRRKREGRIGIKKTQNDGI